VRRAVLDAFGREHGDKAIRAMPTKFLRALLEAMEPTTAKNWLAAIRALARHCIKCDLLDNDQTLRGKPFDPHAFTPWFGEACKAAGLPRECTFHGLRKAACRRLAEAGCTVHEIAAISGHASLREVERYTKAADQAKLARAAMERQAMARRGVA
jgi:integrase